MEPSSRNRAAAAAALLAVAVIGFGLVDAGLSAYLHELLARLEQPPRLDGDFDGDAYELHERLLEHLRLASLVMAATGIAAGLATAALWWRTGGEDRRLRLFSFLAAGASLGTIAANLPQLIDAAGPSDSGEPPDYRALYQIASTFAVLAWVGAVGWVHAFARQQRRGVIAIGLATAGVLSVLPLLYAVFLVGDGRPPQWWRDPYGPLTLPAWCQLLGTLALGAGIAVAATSDDPDAHDRTRQACGGLALARNLVFARVGLGLLTMGLLLADRLGTGRPQRISSRPDPSMAVELVPWVGYLSVLVGIALTVALATVIVQRRSRIAAALVGAGTLAMFVGAVVSLGHNSLLHQIVSADASDVWNLRDRLEMMALYDPYVYWLGIGGMTTMLVGLIVLAATTKRGASTLRAARFIALALAFVAVWTNGQQWLAEVGSGFILLIPVVLFGAIWMLLDLTAFLGEVSYALQRETQPPREEAAEADGPKSWSA